MRSRTIAVIAFAILIAAFAIDAVTPQTLVIAILFDIPIVLAALTRSRGLTASLVVAALVADLAAAVINAAHDGYRWEPIGVGDRFLSGLSIVLVGYLSTAVQERAERVGRLSAQETRARREVALAAAADRIRASLSYDVVVRAIVREAPRALGGDVAMWYPYDAGRESLAARTGGDEVDVLDERAAPEIVSLVHRVIEDATVTVVGPVDLVGRFVLERLAAPGAFALPLIDRGRPFGVLVVTSGSATPDEVVLADARGYAALASNALAQARLFDEISERNEALAERQAVIRDLVDAISHDVRTPLAALAMTLRQAVDGAYGPLPERYAEVLRGSLVSINELQRLAETLLLVARFESGERRIEREPVDLSALLNEVGAEMHALADMRGVNLTVEAGGGVTTRGSRGDLRRAVTNLAANALQHTPSGGHVTLRARVDPAAVEVVVADDGYGVDARLRATLFQRFSGGGSGATGGGLGLYIVRRIAEEGGGTVAFEPARPRGSVFTLSLPRNSALV